MTEVKIRLLHDSGQPGAVGKPGDIIVCEESIANRFIEGKGAELLAVVSESAPEKKPVKRPIGRKKAK